MIQDLRYAIRMLLKKPGFTMISVVALAIGIGASTTIFSVVNAVLLRPLPMKTQPGLLSSTPTILRSTWSALASAPEFIDYRDQAQVFEQIAAFGDVDFTLTGDGPESVRTCRVTASLFPLLGATPARGRHIFAGRRTGWPQQRCCAQRRTMAAAIRRRPEHCRHDGDARRSQVRRGRRHAPPIPVSSFQFPLWAPGRFVDAYRLHGRGARASVAIQFQGYRAALRANLSVEKAQAEMDTLASRLQQQYPRSYRGPTDEDGGWKITATSLEELVVARVRPGLLILLSAVAFVLLIGCANVANLMVARGLGRQKEVAVHSGSGSRSRSIGAAVDYREPVACADGRVGSFSSLCGVMTCWPHWRPRIFRAPVKSASTFAASDSHWR